MFERFGDDARNAVVWAQEEARGLGHGRIGTVHLLLALMDAQDGPAARALREHGASAPDLRAAAQAAPAPERRPRAGRAFRLFGDHIPFSTGAKKALKLSLREAAGLGHRRIGGAHVLLGVLRADGGAARALEKAGVDTGALGGTAERLARASERPR
ncbi:Clp protease N-terminal domain-containing protein [Nocardiopsis baichengensis]|uniref:Clp protease N-terminal domain-containing protein n=1 Tax=Nocardiopsis baichengensis TaxID=280240 RepID=UPI000347429D|nr:Clp protease N-terminal domain-containing protein [Nocardiopsis baichengensis]